MATKPRAKYVDEHADKLQQYDKIIREYIDYWVPILGLDSWIRIGITCNPGQHPTSPGTMGDATVSWAYMEADIEFYLGNLVSGKIDKKRLEYIVVHELLHCIVNEMREDGKHDESNAVPHEERVVCSLASAFTRLRYF